MSNAKSSFGTVLSIGNGGTAEIFIPIGEVGNIKGPTLALATEDVTNHDSPDAFEEFIGTTANGGEVSFPVNLVAADAGQLACEQALIDKTIKNFTIEFPDGTGKAFAALVTKFDRGGPVKGKLSADITLKVTGKPADLP